MSDASAGQGPDDAAKDRANERRIARLSLVAALIGALVGGGATLLAARQQIRSETEGQVFALNVEAGEVRAEFLRRHRLRACGVVLEADRELSSEEGSVRTWLEDRPVPPRAEVEHWALRASRMRELSSDLFRAIDSLELVGSEPVRLAAQRLLAGHAESVNTLGEAVDQRERNPGAGVALRFDVMDPNLRRGLVDQCREDASADLDGG